ncbi:hypothetical protein E2C01_012371 [Portunus trituberculatus]|uniref:Uncharacterized protein n=1 Tax=Portunus trituberculatus TaxID=210409 RepID=A0A5B7DEC9_PORTR|nr:hypothetical protein [Portunus trituberculatus]
MASLLLFRITNNSRNYHVLLDLMELTTCLFCGAGHELSVREGVKHLMSAASQSRIFQEIHVGIKIVKTGH